MASRVNYRCFIPSCSSSIENTPGKKFVRVPVAQKIRETWLKAGLRLRTKTPICDNSPLFCCEDHFNLKEDTVDKWKQNGSKSIIKLKRGVVPHIIPKQVSFPSMLIEKKGDNVCKPRILKLIKNFDGNCNKIDETVKSSKEIPEQHKKVEYAQKKVEAVLIKRVEMPVSKKIELSTPKKIEMAPLNRDIPPLKKMDGSITKVEISPKNSEMLSKNIEMIVQKNVEPVLQKVDTSSRVGSAPLRKKQKVVKEILAWIPSDPTMVHSLNPLGPQSNMKQILLVQPTATPSPVTPSSTIVQLPTLEAPSTPNIVSRVGQTSSSVILVKPNQAIRLQAPTKQPSTKTTIAAPMLVQNDQNTKPISPASNFQTSNQVQQNQKNRVILPAKKGSITENEVTPGLNLIKKEYNEFRRTITLLSLEIQKLRAEVDEIKNQRDFLTLKINSMTASDKKKAEDTLLTALGDIFSPNQIKMLLNKSDSKIRVTWSNEEIIKALTLRNISPRAYRYVRTVLKLPFPAPSSLRRCNLVQRKKGVVEIMTQPSSKKKKQLLEVEEDMKSSIEVKDDGELEDKDSDMMNVKGEIILEMDNESVDIESGDKIEFTETGQLLETANMEGVCKSDYGDHQICGEDVIIENGELEFKEEPVPKEDLEITCVESTNQE